MIYILKNNEKRTQSIQAMLWVILFSIVLPFSGTAQIPDPPVPARLVNDFANLIPPAEEALLEQQLVGYDDSTSTQIVIVTIKDLGNYDISEFSYELGDKWGVGRAGKDNGIVITLSEKDRRVFIATGWGIEGYITDVQARQIIDQYMIPHFQQGNYYEGFQQGTRVIAGLLSGTFDGERLKKEPEGPPIGSIFLLFLVIIIIVSAFRGGGRRWSNEPQRMVRTDYPGRRSWLWWWRIWWWHGRWWFRRIWRRWIWRWWSRRKLVVFFNGQWTIGQWTMDNGKGTVEKGQWTIDKEQ